MTPATLIIAGRNICIPWDGILTFTPNDAEIALSVNTGNRRVRGSLVDYLCRCIQGGEWQSDHPQPVVFSAHGRLIDGQHRMLAIQRTGCSADIHVRMGARDALRDYIDTGLSRTLEDRVTFDPDLQTNKNIASVINSYGWLVHNKNNKIAKLTPDEAKSIFGLHEESMRFAASLMSKNLRGISKAATAVAFVGFYERDKEKAAAFLTSLCTVDGDVQQARVLRDFLLTSTYGFAGQGASRLVYGKSIAAMKANIENREIKILRVTAW
jgi:hypothetical protein